MTNPRHHHYKEKEDARETRHKSRNIFVKNIFNSSAFCIYPTYYMYSYWRSNLPDRCFMQYCIYVEHGNQKSDNLQHNMLAHWVDGINNSSTKLLIFQALFFFIISYRLGGDVFTNISWLMAAIACIFFLLIVMVARIATQKRQGLAPTSFFYILSSQSFCGPRNITVPYNCQAPFTLQELWRQLLHELFVPATQRIILKIVGFQMVAPRVLKPNYSCKWLTLQSCFFDNFL